MGSFKKYGYNLKKIVVAIWSGVTYVAIMLRKKVGCTILLEEVNKMPDEDDIQSHSSNKAQSYTPSGANLEDGDSSRPDYPPQMDYFRKKDMENARHLANAIREGLSQIDTSEPDYPPQMEYFRKKEAEKARALADDIRSASKGKSR